MHRPLFVLVAVLFVCLAVAPSRIAAAGRAAARSTKTFVYVHDNESPDNRVFGFQFNADGTLTPVDGSPFSTGDDGGNCGGLCQTGAASNEKDLLFVSGKTGITVFRIAGSGALAVVPGSPFGGALTLGVAAVEKRSQTFVYGAQFANDIIAEFQVQSDGSLAPLPALILPPGAGPVGLSSAKNLLCAALQNGGKIAAFKVGNTGALVEAPESPFSTPSNFIYNVHVEPGGKFVYANDADSSDLFAFKVNKRDASLTPVPNDAFTDTLADSESLAVSNKPVLFSLDKSSSGVEAFRRNKDGSLTAMGRVQDSGLSAQSGVGAFDPTGRFLVLADDGDDLVRSFSVSQTTGAITTVDTEKADLGSDNANAVVFAQP